MGKFKLTKREKSWILYDVGNSAFTMMVSTLIPIFFNALAGDAGISDTNYLAYWGYAGSVATLLTAVIGPVFGTIADRKDTKKRVFLVSLILGAAACILMGFAWSWLAFLVIYVLAKVSYSSSLVFYDAMLPETTTEDRMDNVSSQGYAWGYIGSCIPFIICIVVYVMSNMLNLISIRLSMILVFLITAVWWVAMSVPLIRTYRQDRYVEARGNPFVQSFRQLPVPAGVLLLYRRRVHHHRHGRGLRHGGRPRHHGPAHRPAGDPVCGLPLRHHLRPAGGQI